MFTCFGRMSLALLTGLLCTAVAGAEVIRGAHLSWRGDPATTVVVSWSTDRSCRGVVRYGAGGGLNQTATETESRQDHQVELKRLGPETVYRYQVVSNGAADKIRTFRTGIRGNKPFSFAVYGDSKWGKKGHRKVVARILERQPHFILSVGDLVSHGTNIEQWNNWFFPVAVPLISQIPYMPALGDHEYAKAKHKQADPKETEDIWNRFFALPGNGLWYSFDYGNAHFVALDYLYMYKKDDAQLKWLERDLAATRKRWKFAYFHRPLYSNNTKYYKDRGGDIKIRRLYEPIFIRYGMTVVLQGHIHNYERIHVGKITYVVTGGGGGGLSDLGSQVFPAAARHKAYHFVLVNVGENRVSLQAIDLEGKVIDRWTSQPVRRRASLAGSARR